MTQKILVTGNHALSTAAKLRDCSCDQVISGRIDNTFRSHLQVNVIVHHAQDYDDAVTVGHTVRKAGFIGKLFGIFTEEPKLDEVVELLTHDFDGYEVISAAQDSRYKLLAAKIFATTRTSHSQKMPVLQAGDLFFDPVTERAWVGETNIHLSPCEKKILLCLMQTEGRVYSRGTILNQCRGVHIHVTQRVVDVQIGRLRKVLMRAGVQKFRIETVRGSGYRAAWQTE